MFTELEPFTTWGINKESINEGLKEAHKVFVLLPWEFHLIFGGPWLSRQGGGSDGKKKYTSSSRQFLTDKIRREAECDCEQILRSKLEMEDRELPISIEIQKEVYSKKYEEKYGKEKYDETLKVKSVSQGQQKKFILPSAQSTRYGSKFY